MQAASEILPSAMLVMWTAMKCPPDVLRGGPFGPDKRATFVARWT